MKKQRINPFPKRMSLCLAVIFMAIATFAGYGETEVAAGIDPANAAADELIWVRQEPAVVNVNKDPLRIEATEPRFAGTFTQYTVQETNFSWEHRYVDHGNEAYHVTINSYFDRPPIVLRPPLRYKIGVTFTHGGTTNWGFEGLGWQFWYNSDWSILEPKGEVFKYYPWSIYFDGSFEKDWIITPPAALREGETFTLYAGWWNCPPCNVTWTYRAERAAEVERLGIEVVRPVVTYQGEEVPPGDMYFPETCPSTSIHADEPCDEQQQLEEKAKIALFCTRGLRRLRALLLLELLDLTESGGFDLAIVKLKAYGFEEKCGALAGQQADQADGYRLDLGLEEGAVQLSNAIAGQTISVDTALGTATTSAQDALIVAYNPKSNTAAFRAFATPLTLQPKTGAKKILQPYQQVELTAKGFGPVKELPHLFLPVLLK